MAEYYKTDEHGVFVGSLNLSEFDAIPRGTYVAPPVVDAGQFAQWNGVAWVVLDNYPQPLPTLEDYDAALTAHLDYAAQSKRYADRISCSVRAGYPGPFQAEGIAFATWMDTCNQIGYAILADYQAGNIPQPSVEDVIAALPPMVWPT